MIERNMKTFFHRHSYWGANKHIPYKSSNVRGWSLYFWRIEIYYFCELVKR